MASYCVFYFCISSDFQRNYCYAYSPTISGDSVSTPLFRSIKGTEWLSQPIFTTLTLYYIDLLAFNPTLRLCTFYYYFMSVPLGIFFLYNVSLLSLQSCIERGNESVSICTHTSWRIISFVCLLLCLLCNHFLYITVHI